MKKKNHPTGPSPKAGRTAHMPPDEGGLLSYAGGLARERDRLQNYLDIVETIIVALDAHGIITTINKKGCRLLGYREDELVGKSWFATCLPRPDGMDKVYPVFLKLMTGELQSLEYFENTVITKTGDLRIIAWHNALIRDEQGAVTGTISAGDDVTKKRMVEQQLQESEKKYRNLFDHAIVGMYRSKIDGSGILEVNQSLCNIFNLTSEEMLFGPALQLWANPEDRKRMIALLEKEGVVNNFEADMVAKGGKIKRCLLSVKLYPDRGYLEGTTIDITARRRAEENYRRLFNEMLNGFALHEVVCDDDGRPVNYRYLAANPAFERMTGLNARDIIGRLVTDVLPGVEQYWIDRFGQVAVTRKPALFENYVEVLKKHFEVTAFSPAPGQFACIFADVTDQKQARVNLQKEHDLLSSIAETSPVGITFVNRDGQIVFANRQAETILGLSRDEITKQAYNAPLWHITAENGDPLDDRELPFRQVTTTGKPVYGVRHAVAWPDGRRILLSVNAAPLLDEQGNVDGMVAALEDITEQKKSEEKIRESEEKFSKAFEKAPMIMTITSIADGRIIDVNEEFTKLSGFTRQEAIGQKTLDLGWISPQERDRLIPELERKGALEGMEIEVRNKNGQKLTCLVYAERITIAGQSRMLTLAQDITMRKEAEEALRESEEKFSKIFQKTPLLMTITSLADSAILDINEAFTRFSGYSREEAIGKTPLELGLVSPEGRDLIFQELARTGSIENVQVEARIKDGSKITALAYVQMIQIGGEMRALTLVQDITERKRAQDALLESEAVFRSTFTQSPIGAVIVSLDKKFLTVNKAFCDFLGYSESELIGKEIKDVTYPDDVEKGMPELKMMMEGKLEAAHVQKRYLRKDGKVVWGDLTISLVRNANNTPLYFLPIIQDITLRKQAEEERMKLEDQLRQSQKLEAIGRLAGGVAHDFNNMLAVIIGHTELALDHIPPATPPHNDLLAIRKATEHSAGLVRQLLAFARKQTVSPQVLNLNDAVQNMFNILKRLIGEDVDLVWLPGEGLWPVRIDPGQIDQILANLCINARDAIAGTGRIMIQTQNITCDNTYRACHDRVSSGDYVLLTVADTGCGMDAATLTNIFEPFFTTKEVGKGSGLGLATVYGIVSQNNAFIDVQSTPGRGTTFSIYLSRHSGNSQTCRPGAEANRTQTGNETLLLVEDDPALLKLTEIMLRRLGYIVLPAASPNVAFRLAREHGDKINLLITDVIMPDMNGRDLADNLRAEMPHLRCLFMSGYTADVIARQGVLKDGVDFLQKPFFKNDLARKVREILDRKP